ncbi:MAG: hypothetical protein IT267_09575 [Saprospiraceae bacterium]|nr:hypothetical protein [Saprospiraceae bacterium]
MILLSYTIHTLSIHYPYTIYTSSIHYLARTGQMIFYFNGFAQVDGISRVFISQVLVKTTCVSGLVFNCCTKVNRLWENDVKKWLKICVIV